MTQILHIDASPRGTRSITRELSREFMEAWSAQHPDDGIIHRDVGSKPPTHLTNDWIEGAYAAPEERSPAAAKAMAESDALVDELIAADLIVIATPMYNFGVPALLKAWVDQIVRVGRTFSSDYEGLLQGKRVLLISSRAAVFGPGSPFEDHDHLEPQMRSIFGFMGITDMTCVHCEGTGMGDEERDKAVAASKARLREIAAEGVGVTGASS